MRPMTKDLCTTSLQLIAILLLVRGTAYTQPHETEVDPMRGWARGALGQHTFIPSSYVPDPFVRTFFHSGLGFGTTPKLVAQRVTLGGTPIVGVNGSLLYALIEVEYQHALRDWIAIRMDVQVLGRMANETPALVSTGVTLVSGYELGWLFRIFGTDQILLSGSLDIQNSSITDVYLHRFIEGIIDSGFVTPRDRLVETTPALRGITALRGAYVFSQLIGLRFSADLGYGESIDRNAPDEWTYSLAAAVDFNLMGTSGTPIGFLAGMRTQSNPLGQLGAGGTSQTFFGRINYTGSEDFSLGMDFGYFLTRVRGVDERQGFFSAVVDTRLYF